MIGTEWTVDRIVRVIDGDSLRIARSRVVDLDGHLYRIADAGPDGVLVRLVWVDTPERGEAGWADAGRHLREWIFDHIGTHPLRVVVYGGAGWDRLLVDLLDHTGASASQWLMTERGWPAYDGGRA